MVFWWFLAFGGMKFVVLRCFKSNVWSRSMFFGGSLGCSTRVLRCSWYSWGTKQNSSCGLPAFHWIVCCDCQWCVVFCVAASDLLDALYN